MTSGAREWSEDELDALFKRCSNTGRWGPDDELGTLNFVTPAGRVRAAELIREGRIVSLAHDIDLKKSAKNPVPATHQMLYEQHHPVSALDYLGVAPHGFAVTHLDAVSHVFHDGVTYNGRHAAATVTSAGLGFGSIYAQAGGIFTRGVLLDVAAARGATWLSEDEFVTTEDLLAAERAAGVRIGSGDAVFVRIGLEPREDALGVEDPTRRAGLHAECLDWLRDREVAVYSGDCVERIPYPSASMKLPLHQIGLAGMGLCLLDCPRLDELTAICYSLDRFEFALSVAPLRITGGTGSPVNPTALF